MLILFCNDTATTEMFTLSLHDALPICSAAMPSTRAGSILGLGPRCCSVVGAATDLPLLRCARAGGSGRGYHLTRPATNPRSEEHTSNSSHANSSYGFFCLTKNTHISVI